MSVSSRSNLITEIHIRQGDITECRVDAIINAANNDLILGGGLAGAIARKGGPEIQAECSRQSPIMVGQAAITGAGNLPARYVIHAASMSLGRKTSEQSLADSVRAVLDLAETHGIKTLALPAIGTGIAGFPLERCASVMLGIVKQHIQGDSVIEEVFFVLFDNAAYNIFREEYERDDVTGA